jgi:hypothetical protein
MAYIDTKILYEMPPHGLKGHGFLGDEINHQLIALMGM